VGSSIGILFKANLFEDVLSGAGTRPEAGRHVNRHFEVHGNAEPAVGKGVDADDFGEVFRAHGVIRGIGKSDEDAHSLVVSRALGDEVDSVFRGVNTVWQVFEMVVAGFGRPNAHGPSKFCASPTAKLGNGGRNRRRAGIGTGIVHFSDFAGSGSVTSMVHSESDNRD
jgi:hypothetical protein